MPRIKIDLPQKYIFSTTIPVRISDVNSAAHVSWNAMFTIMDEAGVQFWKYVKYPEPGNTRISRITVDAGINYKKQAFHGQTLKVEIGANDIASKSFDLIFRITDIATGDEIAIAKAGILCYDYDQQKVIAVPEKLLSKITV